MHICVYERRKGGGIYVWCMQLCTVQGQRKTLSGLFLTLFLGLPLNLELGWWSADHSGPSTSALFYFHPSLGLQNVLPCLAFYVGCWGFKLLSPSLHDKHSYPLTHLFFMFFSCSNFVEIHTHTPLSCLCSWRSEDNLWESVLFLSYGF